MSPPPKLTNISEKPNTNKVKYAIRTLIGDKIAQKTYLVLTIALSIVGIVLLFIWIISPQLGGITMVYLALLNLTLASINLYTYFDICYLENFGERDLRYNLIKSGYREIKNACVCPMQYLDPLSKTEGVYFSVVIPLSKTVRIQTSLAEIIRLNRRFLTMRYLEYNLVFDYLKEDYLLFSKT